MSTSLDSDSDSSPVPVLSSWHWNVNPTLSIMKSSAYYNVDICSQRELKFESESGSGNANKVCFECLRFLLRLSLSVNGQMACVQLNCHSAVQKISCLFTEKPNGNLARHFKIKNIYIFECEWPNGNSNNLCMAYLPFVHSHSNSNTNGN